ncbi:MAG TPA: hypothetical protein VNE40_02645 [Candidatus Dormibacteraeota bacterium]|nr:hypothetical protein [Candidatus Dormibacteraeota bacterium]
MDQQPAPSNQLETLEGSSNADTTTTVTQTENLKPEQPKLAPDNATPSTGVVASPGPRFPKLANRLRHFNGYLVLFVLLFVAAAAIVLAAYLYSKRVSGTSPISSQTLSQSTLQQLANSDATVGNSSQILNVESNAVFAGKVLVRDSLEVAGQLQVGGSLSLSGVTVSGNSSFDQVQINKGLSVAGNTALQGQLNVQNSLSVSGNGTFGGNLSASQLTISGLSLNGELTLTHHITAGGPTPSRISGSALGSGGTSSISGSDSSGSISINTGSNPSVGCLITINFAQSFNATPHVIISPVGSGAANLGYYVNRSTTSFSICVTNTPPTQTGFGFDYLVLD